MLPATKRSAAKFHVFLCMGIVCSKLAPPLIHKKSGKTAHFIRTEEYMPNQWRCTNTSHQHPAIHLAPLPFSCLSKSSKSSSSAQEIKTSIRNLPHSITVTVSWTTDTSWLTPYPFSSRVSTMSTTTFLLLAQREEAKKARTGRANERVFFHLPFCPQNPSSGVIQHLW